MRLKNKQYVGDASYSFDPALLALNHSIPWPNPIRIDSAAERGC